MLPKPWEEALRVIFGRAGGTLEKFQIVGRRENLLKAVVDHRFACRSQLNSKVEVHPCNRDGEGLEENRC